MFLTAQQQGFRRPCCAPGAGINHYRTHYLVSAVSQPGKDQHWQHPSIHPSIRAPPHRRPGSQLHPVLPKQTRPIAAGMRAGGPAAPKAAGLPQQHCHELQATINAYKEHCSDHKANCCCFAEERGNCLPLWHHLELGYRCSTSLTRRAHTGSEELQQSVH